MFDFNKVSDFEKHINLSIPNYNGLCDVFRPFVMEYANPEGNVLDIGCSTGSFLNSLDKREDINYIGSDIVDITKYKNFEFIKDDCEIVLKKLENVDVIISMFTLQFLGKHKRKRVLNIVKKHIENGGIFLVSEKCLLNTKVETVLKREHLQQKRKGFNDSEILNKDKDLFGSMFCLTESELLKELGNVGQTTQIWQSYNFKGYVVFK